MKTFIKNVFRISGLDIIRYNASPAFIDQSLLKKYKIDLVLDCGANRGQYGKYLRGLGYSGRIISFEPLQSAYSKLAHKAKRDKNWETHNFALGNFCGNSKINQAGNSDSSSILQMLPEHEAADPKSKYIGQEDIEIKMLDSIFTDMKGKSNSIFMKIDTQGFEDRVLAGAEQALPEIAGIQLEMSYIPLYENQRLINDLHEYLSRAGYSLVNINPIFHDPNNLCLLQSDGTYFRLK